MNHLAEELVEDSAPMPAKGADIILAEQVHQVVSPFITPPISFGTSIAKLVMIITVTIVSKCIVSFVVTLAYQSYCEFFICDLSISL